jgi:hypothetical protein
MIVQNYIENGKSACRIANCGDGWRGNTLALGNRDAYIEGEISSSNSGIVVKSSSRNINISFERVTITGNPFKISNSSKNNLVLRDNFGDAVITLPPENTIFLAPQAKGKILFSSDIKVGAYMHEKSYITQCLDLITHVADCFNIFQCVRGDSSDYMSLGMNNQNVKEGLLGDNQDT